MRISLPSMKSYTTNKTITINPEEQTGQEIDRGEFCALGYGLWVMGYGVNNTGAHPYLWKAEAQKVKMVERY